MRAIISFILLSVELITGILSLFNICKTAYKELKLYRIINKKRRSNKNVSKINLLRSRNRRDLKL